MIRRPYPAQRPVGGLTGRILRLDDRFINSYFRFMNKPDRFMNELFRIVSGALRLDIDKVRNYTKFLADKLEAEGDRASAGRLRKLLEDSDHTLRPAGVATRAMPVDSDSRFPLLERVAVRTIDQSSPVLDESRWRVVHEFLSISRSYAQLEAEGVATSMSLLLYGPPGVGKSFLARYIAKELGLDLYTARLDGLVSSFLGSTSKNIRALFEFAAQTPCVLFLDEFDAIAKLRGDQQELGELKRVVNSFLQNLDSLGSQTVLIAATNHPELLDKAVWRRFAYRLELGLPLPAQRQQLLQEGLRGFDFTEKDLSVLTDLSEGFSGSDIREGSLRLRRRMVTTHEMPRLADAFEALMNLSSGEGKEGRFLATIPRMGEGEIVRALRLRSSKLYSLNTIAELLGVSKATAFRLEDSAGVNRPKVPRRVQRAPNHPKRKGRQ